MQNNQLLRSGETIIRVLDIKDGQAFIVDCKRQTVPKWVNIDTLTEYETCTDDVIDSLPDINDLDLQSRKFAYSKSHDVPTVCKIYSVGAKETGIVSYGI